MLRRNKRGKLQVNGLHVKFLRIDFYKLFLNLLALAFLGFIIWSALKLFSGSFLQSPLIGSLVFFAEIIAFIFLCRHVRANRWRSPSIVITTLVLIVMAVVMAFAGVSPLSAYKDNIFDAVSDHSQNVPDSIPSNNEAEDATSGRTHPNLDPQFLKDVEEKLSKRTNSRLIEDWLIQLHSAEWSGGTLKAKITITNNNDSRRDFGGGLFGPRSSGYQIVAIDSTEKLAEAWHPPPDKRGLYRPGYIKEYYSMESWTGTLEFIMHPRSGHTALYITEGLAHTGKRKLFDVGSP